MQRREMFFGLSLIFIRKYMKGSFMIARNVEESGYTICHNVSDVGYVID